MEINELIAKFESGDIPTGQDFADLIRACYNKDDAEIHKNENAPHVYGGKFEWRYNENTDSLDLVVLD